MFTGILLKRSRIKYTYNEISVKNTADRRAVSKLRLPDSVGKNEVFNGQKYTKGKKAYSFYRNRRIRYGIRWRRYFILRAIISQDQIIMKLKLLRQSEKWESLFSSDKDLKILKARI